MVTLTHLFVIFLWYAFGWFGATLLYLTLLYSIHTAFMNYNSDTNETLRKIINQLYDYLDFDWTKDNLRDLRIPFPVICIMATIAIFGTYAFLYSFILAVITLLVTLIWNSLQN